MAKRAMSIDAMLAKLREIGKRNEKALKQTEKKYKDEMAAYEKLYGKT